jgi:hypothetical protein
MFAIPGRVRELGDFTVKWFVDYKSDGLYWFRLFGRIGLSIKNTEKLGKSFSESLRMP